MFNFKVWKPFKTTTAILLEGSQHSTNSSATTSQRKKPMSKINGSTFPCLSNMTNPVAGPSTLTCYQYTNISLHEWKVTSYAFISHMPYSKYIIYFNKKHLLKTYPFHLFIHSFLFSCLLCKRETHSYKVSAMIFWSSSVVGAPLIKQSWKRFKTAAGNFSAMTWETWHDVSNINFAATHVDDTLFNSQKFNHPGCTLSSNTQLPAASSGSLVGRVPPVMVLTACSTAVDVFCPMACQRQHQFKNGLENLFRIGLTNQSAPALKRGKMDGRNKNQGQLSQSRGVRQH